jgi:cysteinyl-tRNA synthetase
VRYARNVTDIDDKIIAGLRSQRRARGRLTRRFEAIYDADMAALGLPSAHRSRLARPSTWRA